MMNDALFQRQFTALTGHPPFPWQSRAFTHLENGEFESLATCSVPTGLGKTSLLAVWLLALARNPAVVPRRLVYVVNRRTVVDQTTIEAERIRGNLVKLPDLVAELTRLCSVRRSAPDASFLPLAISTLRGQFADNREWSSDPARPAIISGTVDMIGSRLLFDGYRCGFKSKPLQAGFLGTDTLLIHDEAHLEPAFQALVEGIRNEQINGRFPEVDRQRALKAIELSATTRGNRKPLFKLGKDDYKNNVVKQRIAAKKRISIHSVDTEKQISACVATLAAKHANSGDAVLVFVRRVDDVQKVAAALTKGRSKKLPRNVAQLTGTIRGLERDKLATECPVFQRFLPKSLRNKEVNAVEGTVFLIATAAGEVGVNISADHSVCDLTTYESFAQRLGRVNRFGTGDATIDIVAPLSITAADPKTLTPFQVAMQRTHGLIQSLPKLTDEFDGSPESLASLDSSDTDMAFSPPPEILDVDEILFNAWSQTTFAMSPLKDQMPGKPPVADWLHGVDEGRTPQVQVAWRKEVDFTTDALLQNQTRSMNREQFLEAFPLKPHEIVSDTIKRVADALKSIIKARLNDDDLESDPPVWIVDHRSRVEATTVESLLNASNAKQLQSRLEDKLILLPESVGGLDESGMFVGPKGSNANLDVAELLKDAEGNDARNRFFKSEERSVPVGTRVVLRVQIGGEEPEDEWIWCKRQRTLDDDASSWSANEIQSLNAHSESAEHYAKNFCAALDLGSEISECIRVAALYHDLGKCRKLWQRGIGNTEFNASEPTTAWAKSANYRPQVNAHYRHEFGSLIDLAKQPDFTDLDEDQKQLVMHLVASHHGRARPHFPTNECFDPESDDGLSSEIADSVPARFVNLQRRHGRWQLAWLESLVRASDYLASQKLVQEVAS